MIKIIEAYSSKIMPEIQIEQISWQNVTDKNGIITKKYIPTKLVPFKLKTSPYNSISEINSTILKAKMNAINTENNGVLLIIRHDEKNLCIAQRNLVGDCVQLYSLSVNYIQFYTYDKIFIINEELLHKMNKIYNLILKMDNERFNVLKLTLDTIINNYKSSGVISKDDLMWMNTIYNKYKKYGDLYD